MSLPPLKPDQSAAGIAVDPRTLERVIPESKRPDGSVRKQIKIRPGYTPQEDVRAFKGSKQRAFEEGAVPKGHVVGWAPPAAASSVVGAGAGAKKSAAAKKNEKRREKKKEKKTEAEGTSSPPPVKDSWEDEDDAREDTSTGTGTAPVPHAPRKDDTTSKIEDVSNQLDTLHVR